MAPRPVASQRFRQRKLSTRLALQVIKGEKELETLENDQQSAPKFETGVEKHEESVSLPFSLCFVPILAPFTTSSALPPPARDFTFSPPRLGNNTCSTHFQLFNNSCSLFFVVHMNHQHFSRIVLTNV